MRDVVGVGERHAVGQAGLEQLAGGIVGVGGGAYSRDGRGLGNGLDPAAGVIGVLGLCAVGIGLLGHAAGCVVGVIGQGGDIRDIGARAVDLDDLAEGVVLHAEGARDRIAGGGEAALGGGD